jgi:hypothetical protein
MSLMQLLTVGQSFQETKDGPSGYKLEKNALPKFAPVKRPVSLAPARTVDTPRPMATAPLFPDHESPAAMEVLGNHSEEPNGVLAKDETVPRPNIGQTPLPLFEQNAPTKPATPAPPRPATPFSPEGRERLSAGETRLVSRDAALPDPKRRWWEFFFRRKRKNAFSRPLQAEWSLDRVKVIRNELNDTDIDLIPGGQPAPAQAARTEVAIAGKSWSRLTARLFQANRGSF